jgi:hypothetical protein
MWERLQPRLELKRNKQALKIKENTKIIEKRKVTKKTIFLKSRFVRD